MFAIRAFPGRSADDSRRVTLIVRSPVGVVPLRPDKRKKMWQTKEFQQYLLNI